MQQNDLALAAKCLPARGVLNPPSLALSPLYLSLTQMHARIYNKIGKRENVCFPVQKSVCQSVMSACMYVCVSACLYLSLCVFVPLFACVYECLPVYVGLHICVSVCLSKSLYIACISVYMS